ncbi:fibronectin type 3 and ankyrin repeat domains protein 1-like isoform X2 [Watersipora subatra]|uniref:fibronectin type 3 and ankyrin repeat domains protein 1-like isoform X2 n=1 Tax=Watersipora subatra TaxID=2589382 RepID=UPI00355C0B86
MSGVPERPPPPIVGKVTHHNIELYWNESLEKACENNMSGDERVRVAVQEEDKHGEWGNVYVGYAKQHSLEGLEPQTLYRYRIRFQNDEGNSEWSQVTSVSTTKEPLTGIHLHRAVMMNDIMGVERILETGFGPESEVNAEVTDKYGFTPLMQAAQKGYTEIMEILLNHGADVNTANDSGKTALMLASFAGKTPAVELLRENNAKYDLRDKGGSTAFHWAIDGQHLDTIQWCIDDCWDVNIKDTGSQWTPLLRCAAVNGNADVAKLLIKNDANINFMDADGKTALMIAVINGHQNLVELLLKHEADIKVKNAFGKNAYEMAQSMEKRRITKTLEEHMEKLGMSIK